MTAQSKRVVNRVMIDARKDPFYGQPYTVVERTSLNFFDPVANSNKFYIAEVHQSDAGNGYRFYVNHGRVGAKGAVRAEPFMVLAEAKRKYLTKTREKLRKGYVEVDLATLSRGSKQGQKQINAKALQGVIDTKNIPQRGTKLQPKIATLVKQIYEEANQAVSLSLTGSVKTDIRAPLGNLGINGINRGKELLSLISRALRVGNLHQVRAGSIEYYRNVPRKLPSDIRDESKWILNTARRIEKELEILELYEDTLRMLPVMGLSDLDSKYQALNCDIRYVTDQDTLSYINHKVSTTHAPNHNYKLKVVNVFEVNMKNAPPFDTSVGNVRKFFHGSRSANLVGILSSYLKLPHTLSSDVHRTGAMFGPGIYFASDCTKSFNYSHGNWSGRPNKYPTSFLLIAEVAMGNVYKANSPQNFRQPPAGYHSVMGVRGNYLQNHEFIVYRPEQVRVRYLVECKKI